MRVKVLVKTLAVCAILSSLTACKTNKTAQQSLPNNSARAVSSTIVVSSPKSNDSAKVTKINVLEKEMAIQAWPATVPAGLVEFVVKNEGEKPHELVVFRNNLLGKKLPLKGGNLDEEIKAVKYVGEIDQSKLKSGATQTLKLKLAPGRYLLVCNLPGHIQAGMKAEFTVKWNG